MLELEGEDEMVMGSTKLTLVVLPSAEAEVPMVVEFAATIPSKYKITSTRSIE